MVFVIVKQAGFDHLWPKDFVFTLANSCHETHTGKEEGIKPSYLTHKDAAKALKSINARNPSGYYGIKKVRADK